MPDRKICKWFIDTILLTYADMLDKSEVTEKKQKLRVGYWKFTVSL